MNDLARRLRKEMRKSHLRWKHAEGEPKSFPRHNELMLDMVIRVVPPTRSKSKLWQAGGKARFIYLPPGHLNDPCLLRHSAGCSFYQGEHDNLALDKSSLINLDAYGYRQAA